MPAIAREPLLTEGDLLKTVLAKTDPMAIVEAKSMLDILAKDRSPEILTHKINMENIMKVESRTINRVLHSEVSHSIIRKCSFNNEIHL